MITKTAVLLCLLALAAMPCHADDALDVRDRMVAAGNAGDIPTMLELFSEDAIHAIPDERPFVGRDAIAGFLEIVYSRFDVTADYSFGEEHRDGNSVTWRGRVHLTWRNKESGEAPAGDYGCVWTLRKIDGTWHVAELIQGDAGSAAELVGPIPAPTGPWPVGTMRFVLEDPSREESLTDDPHDRRTVALEVWYPAAPVPDSAPRPYATVERTRAVAEFFGWPTFVNSFVPLAIGHSHLDAPVHPEADPMPVLIYNHGYSGFTSVHQILFEDLASHGYLVASIGHAHESSIFILEDGSIRSFDPEGAAYRARMDEATGQVQEAAKDRIMNAGNLEERRTAYADLIASSPLHQESVRLWTADSGFVLDQLARMNDEVFAGRIDLDRVGALGHSLGGATAGQLALVDERVDAGINIDGFQFGDLLDEPLRKPFLFMGAQRPWAGEDMISNDLFFEDSLGPAHIVLFRGFTHSSFSDLVWFGLADHEGDGARALELQRDYVRAFFDHYLRDEPSRLLRGPSADHPEAIVRSR